MALFSLQVEKHALGGLIQNPEVISEVDRFIKDRDFVSDAHNVIYSCIRSSYLNNEKIDKVLLAQKIKNLGISFKDDINIFDYIDSISFTPVTPEATIKSCQEVVKLRALRDIEKTADKIKQKVNQSANQDLGKTVGEIDSIYADQIGSFETEVEPDDLFSDIYEMVEDTGNNPVEEVGMKTPFPEFNRMYGGLRGGNIYAFASRAKQGKALLVGTPIPTPTGFTNIEDLKVGDEVFALDGSITKVVAMAFWKDRPIYKVFSNDGSFVYADENHEWVVRRRSDYPWETLTSKQIHENPLKDKRRIKLPLIGSLKLPEADLPIPPYILGLWLGDGTSNEPAITKPDEFIIKKWAEYGVTLGLNLKTKGEITHTLTRSGKNKGYFHNPLTQKLRDLNIFKNKHIPLIYLRSSHEQRLALLQGLIDSDGCVSDRGEIEFCNKSKTLAQDTCELVHTLGLKCSLNESRAALYGKDCGKRYRITFFSKDACLLPRKREKLVQRNFKKANQYIESEPAGRGDTVCIEVDHPSHIFLCGKGMLPTHNSTLLGHLAIESGKLNACPVLILDTEMTSKEVKFRMAANRSGVPLWYLESGQWRKNKDMVEKVRQKLVSLKNDQKVFHYYVGNKDVDQVCSIIRRWILKVVGRGKPCIIVYDYLKLTGEKLGANWAEYQALGEKVNKFKALSVEFNFPFLTAVQMNRSGEGSGKSSNEMNDDSSSIAQSDRIMWFCTYLGIFRRKTEDEIALDTPESGTHKLIEIAARYQGRDAAGHQDWVQRRFPDGKVKNVHNYINFNIDNFNVEERGSIRDSIARGNAMYLVSDNNSHPSNETL